LNGGNGINLGSSNKNKLTNNTASNNYRGILVSSSNNNLIYHNNFISNTNQASDGTNNGNKWDDGYPNAGNYWSNYGGIDEYRGPGQNISGGDGIGDTPYVIDSDSRDNYPLMKKYKRSPESSIILLEGWNLISIPFLQADQNLTKALEKNAGNYNAVQWYDITDSGDTWKHHKISKPYGNDLYELNETMSFWIHINRTGDTIFLYNGTEPASNQTISLHPGWNMVGYPSLSSHNRTTGLNNLSFDTHIDCIQWYDAWTKTWHFMGPDDSFVPGRGYWVHSKVEAEWEVPI
jgi:parallel beta-helix repeat protein